MMRLFASSLMPLSRRTIATFPISQCSICRHLCFLSYPTRFSSPSLHNAVDKNTARYSTKQPSTSEGDKGQSYDRAYVIKEKKLFESRLGMTKKDRRNFKAIFFGGLATVVGVLSWVYSEKFRRWSSGESTDDIAERSLKKPLKRLYFSSEGPEHMASYVPPVVESPIVLPNPPKYTKLPDHVKYLIVGSGAAGLAASKAIRGADAEAKVLVIGEENHLPYMRPPLSKELWFTDDRKILEDLKFQMWTGKERSIYYEKDAFYCDPMQLNEKQHGGVSVVSGRKVVKLDLMKHEAILDDNSKIKYDKCLIATGGSPKIMKEIEDSGEEVMKHVTLYRRLDDFCKLEALVKRAKSFVIVGGGFLGTELACALAHKTKDAQLKITQLFPESGNLSKILPEYLCKWTTDKLRKEGIDVLTNATVEKATCASGGVNLHLKDGRSVYADHVIVAVGIEPNVELARTSGLEIDPEIGGFRCDAELRTRSDVWVAGDCCSFYDPQLGRRRVEHQDHAVVSGRLAGENMAGANKPYQHQSMFWSDIGPEFGLEAIGLIDSSLPTVGVFANAAESDTSPADSAAAETSTELRENTPNEFDKGVVFYLRENKIVGILLWNLYSRISIARRILKEDTVFEDLNEVAKLFNIHDAPPISPKEE